MMEEKDGEGKQGAEREGGRVRNGRWGVGKEERQISSFPNVEHKWGPMHNIIA